MDPLSGLLGLEEPENDENQEPKQKEKKKRISFSMAKKLQAKMAEEARQLLIRQKQDYLRETKRRVQEEWVANQAKSQVYEAEFEKRKEELKFSSKALSLIDVSWNEHLKQLRKNQEWLQYLTCGRLPDPSSVSRMNSYVFVWTEINTCDQITSCMKKTEEVMKLLDGVQEVIDDSESHQRPNFLQDIKELRNEIRRLLQDNIDRATFNLFSRIETHMEPINVTTSKFFAKCPHFLMSLWAELITPIPSSRGKEIRHPLKVVFEEVEVTVVLPVSLLNVIKVMRAMWLNYDHWSDRCRTYEVPLLPDYHKQTMYQLFLDQFEVKREIVEYREKLETLTKKKTANLPAEPTLSQEILAWDGEPQKVLSEEVFFRECEEEDDMHRYTKSILNEFEVNLRERTLLGDLLLVEVLHQPPQPKYLRFKHSVTLREEPPKLHPVDFYVKYPPPREEEGEEEEEEEMIIEHRRIQHSFGKSDEDELKNLVEIQLKLCQSVLWFENPLAANWDPNHGYWSSEDIHDIQHDKEEGIMEFKTGRLGLMGLHVSRYCNFPYQDWIFEANEEGGVNFYLKTSKIELYFKIKEGEVCLELMKDAPSKAMNWIFGLYYPPTKLVQLMKKGGIDVFPAPDAASYIEEIHSKHVVVERNIYMVWGLFSTSFRFRRSKFNQIAGRRNIVFQAQEIYENHQVDFCLIQTAMCSSYILDINEEEENYSPEPAPYSETYVDLYSLLYRNSTRQARRYADTSNYLLVQTIKEFMNFVRPVSFS